MIVNNQLIVDRPRIGSGLCELEVQTPRSINIDTPTITELGAFERWMDHSQKIDQRWDVLACIVGAVGAALVIIPLLWS